METELRVAAPTVARVAARVAAAVVATMVAARVAAAVVATMVVVMVAATKAVALVIAGGKGEEAEREASSVAPKAEELPVVPVGRVMTRWSASAQRHG